MFNFPFGKSTTWGIDERWLRECVFIFWAVPSAIPAFLDVINWPGLFAKLHFGVVSSAFQSLSTWPSACGIAYRDVDALDSQRRCPGGWSIVSQPLVISSVARSISIRDFPASHGADDRRVDRLLFWKFQVAFGWRLHQQSLWGIHIDWYPNHTQNFVCVANFLSPYPKYGIPGCFLVLLVD